MSTKKKFKFPQLKFSTIILIMGFLFLLIPLGVLASIILQSSSKTGNVILGNRYKNDLDPAITQANITAIQTALSSTTNVENVTIDLKSATLRITIDALDTITSENMVLLASTMLNTIQSTLPIETYFTSTDSKKMYDLEITLYNSTVLVESETFTLKMFILTKNASMEAFAIQDVSTARNPTLAEELRAALEGTSP
ncbi:MAG: hypothetical protein WCI62_01035 [Erysipelotrichaceae bacterium]